jgi:3-hydroxybutyryl-CoA dehydrogenase
VATETPRAEAEANHESAESLAPPQTKASAAFAGVPGAGGTSRATESGGAGAGPGAANAANAASAASGAAADSGPSGVTATRAVAVLGTGTMGQGIAQVAARAGFIVRLYDELAGRASAAVAAVNGQLDKLVAKGKLAAPAAEDCKGRLQPASSVEDAVFDAELVIEAIPESMDLKVTLLRAVVEKATPHALIASNTSSLSLTEIGARIGAAERTVGMHFFNPPPVMELVEIVRGLATSEATIDRALEWAQRFGKTAIVVRDVPGFATSRLGVILGAEAMRMLETGVAKAEDIDRAMELGYRHPMGPLKLTDLVGLDVRLAILEHLQREIGEQFRPPALLRTMVRAGRLGKKTGEGFYIWKDGVAVRPAGAGAPAGAESPSVGASAAGASSGGASGGASRGTAMTGTSAEGTGGGRTAAGGGGR